MKKNILVFPCGSEIGLEIHRSLSFATHFNLFGGSSVDDHGKFVYKDYIGDIPNVKDGRFVESLNEVIKEKKIDYILPAHDDVLLKLAQENAKNNLGAKLVASPLETCEIARSKLRTYQNLKGVVKAPKIYKEKDLKKEALPVFLKPDIGQGSKGVQLAESLEDVNYHLKKNPNLLILEYLPGKEFTIDCFTDRKGRLRFYEGRERRRIQNGISVNSAVVKDDRFKVIAEEINKEVKLRGVWFFQVKEDVNRELTLMEIAPRVAGTMALARCRGINLVLLSMFDFMDYEVNIEKNNYDVVIDRALYNSYTHNMQYKHVYLDFDDLVIFEDKVNPSIMSFVYQCINKGIKVHLLTRHKADLDKTLKSHRLTGIFDEVVWLKEGESKSDYIKEKEAILIDDSFAERNEVHKKLNIPVFDAHSVEVLREGF